ncbi:hypothetical protein LA76x_4994 [Lysobacter antibioticus]|uniref:Uncharacterized protein n=1 Tax=Lysobacter antibioticus TaxID=84531 RepID=A0A0S2FHS6_LYSAN|nr:hypothetical protein LA76x_4994 [Lysobacter antibioticus]
MQVPVLTAKFFGMHHVVALLNPCLTLRGCLTSVGVWLAPVGLRLVLA